MSDNEERPENEQTSERPRVDDDGSPFGGSEVRNGYVREEDRYKAKEAERKKTVLGVLTHPTPDNVLSALIDGAGTAIHVGWYESARAVRETVKDAMKGDENPENQEQGELRGSGDPKDLPNMPPMAPKGRGR